VLTFIILLGEIVVAEVVVVFVIVFVVVVVVVVVVVAGVVVVVCRMGGGGKEVSGSCVDWLYFDLSPDDEYLTDTTLTDLLTLTSDGSG
jgi:hypothetical protein